jgi:hypothetical protein
MVNMGISARAPVAKAIHAATESTHRTSRPVTAEP